MSNGSSGSGRFINDLISRLQTAGAGKAWKEFLDSYAPTIMHVASQYEYDRDRLNDCYLYICEKLSDNDFRRLLSYRPDSSAGFRSWLGVVIANLCIDWRRREDGRARPFKSITELSQLDQLIFKYRFEQGMGLQECLGTLQGEFPDLTASQLAGTVSQLNETLTPGQHWLLGARRAETVSLDSTEFSPSPNASLDPEDPTPGPEELAEQGEEQDRLSRALGQLTPRQRLLIKLRYQQDLTLKEVARLTRLGDPFRARRHIQAALDELARLLEA